MTQIELRVTRGWLVVLSVGNPDGYFQVYWTWGDRAYCLSFKKGLERGDVPWPRIAE